MSVHKIQNSFELVAQSNIFHIGFCIYNSLRYFEDQFGPTVGQYFALFYVHMSRTQLIILVPLFRGNRKFVGGNQLMTGCVLGSKVMLKKVSLVINSKRFWTFQRDRLLYKFKFITKSLPETSQKLPTQLTDHRFSHTPMVLIYKLLLFDKILRNRRDIC